MNASFQSTIAGTAVGRKWANRYYPLTQELLRLRKEDAELAKTFFVRDKQFDTRFTASQAVFGSFKHSKAKREAIHLHDIMPAIRRRTMLIRSINRQQTLNNHLSSEARKAGAPEPREALRTPDSTLYFSPRNHVGTVGQPNYWQHPSNIHVVPKANWERHPELGGITRVHNVLPKQLLSF
jgi:hypothetical protein